VSNSGGQVTCHQQHHLAQKLLGSDLEVNVFDSRRLLVRHGSWIPPLSFGLLLTPTLDVPVAVFCAGPTYRDPEARGIFGIGSACEAGMLHSFHG
jgi:hypothetical protein